MFRTLMAALAAISFTFFVAAGTAYAQDKPATAVPEATNDNVPQVTSEESRGSLSQDSKKSITAPSLDEPVENSEAPAASGIGNLTINANTTTRGAAGRDANAIGAGVSALQNQHLNEGGADADVDAGMSSDATPGDEAKGGDGSAGNGTRSFRHSRGGVSVGGGVKGGDVSTFCAEVRDIFSPAEVRAMQRQLLIKEDGRCGPETLGASWRMLSNIRTAQLAAGKTVTWEDENPFVALACKLEDNKNSYCGSRTMKLIPSG